MSSANWEGDLCHASPLASAGLLTITGILWLLKSHLNLCLYLPVYVSATNFPFL